MAQNQLLNLPKDELAQLYKEDNKKYMELWDECNSKSEQLITSAVKLMQFEPAVLTYFGLCDLKPVKDPQVTLRLNCRGTGAAINMEYNPMWVVRIEEASILAYCMYCECLRIALHHITTRKNFPIDCFKKASDYICFDKDQRSVVNVHKPEVLKVMDTFPTKDKFHEEAKGYKFDNANDWFLEKVFAVLNDIKQKKGGDSKMGQQSQQQQQQQQGQGKGNGSGQGNQQGKGKGPGKGGQGNGQNQNDQGDGTRQALEE